MRRFTFLLAFCVLVAALAVVPAAAQKPLVKAVMFYSKGCPHCEVVINDLLPPLQLKYRDSLDIAMIEVSAPPEFNYFQQVEDYYKLPVERRGVPALFIGDSLLVGEVEIPQQLPGLIEKYLAAGGVDYPGIPGLADHLPQFAGAQPSDQTTAAPLAALDPVAAPAQAKSNGYALAIAITVLMIAALLYALITTVLAASGRDVPLGPAWAENLIPLLCLIGIGIAFYLTYVETQNVAAVCGPVGDCNTVQSSRYARLAGVPVGLIGLIGYIAILIAWATNRFAKGRLADLAAVALMAMTLFGVLFSLYLTYLELAVIHAVCIWCLSSAVIMALLLVISVWPAMLGLTGSAEAPE